MIGQPCPKCKTTLLSISDNTSDKISVFFCNKCKTNFIYPLILNEPDIEKRIEDLNVTVERELPKMGELVKSETANLVILHQDAFAADYQDEEYKLLGMAIKYIGLSGKEIRIIGKNRETLNEEPS